MKNNNPESASSAVERKLKEIAALFEEQDCDYYMDGALSELAKLAEMQPDNADIYYWKGKCHDGLGQEEESKNAWDKAIIVDDRHLLSYLALADYYQDKDADKSFDLCSKVVDMDASCIHAWSSMISRMKYTRQPEQAEQLVTELLERNPTNPDAWMAAGQAAIKHYAFEKEGDDQLVLERFNKAISLNPDDRNYYYQRYFVHTRMGEHQKALEDLEYQKKLQSNIILDDHYVDTYKSLGEYEKAVALVTQLIKKGYDPHYQYYNRAMIHKDTGDYASALKDINMALKRCPKYDEEWKQNFYAERADIHFRNGKLGLALQSIDKAISKEKASMSQPGFVLQKAEFLYDSDMVKAKELAQEVKDAYEEHPLMLEHFNERLDRILKE